MNLNDTAPPSPYLNPRIWCVYALCLLTGIPWYWASDESRLFQGIPVWVWVSLGASIAASIFTAWLLWARWPASDAEETSSSKPSV